MKIAAAIFLQIPLRSASTSVLSADRFSTNFGPSSYNFCVLRAGEGLFTAIFGCGTLGELPSFREGKDEPDI
jgi:hypothetical protein